MPLNRHQLLTTTTALALAPRANLAAQGLERFAAGATAVEGDAVTFLAQSDGSSKQYPAVIARSTRAIFGDSLDIALVQPVIDVGARYGLLKRTFPAAEILAQ